MSAKITNMCEWYWGSMRTMEWVETVVFSWLGGECVLNIMSWKWVCENDENEGNEARVHELLHECIDCAYLELWVSAVQKLKFCKNWSSEWSFSKNVFYFVWIMDTRFGHFVFKMLFRVKYQEKSASMLIKYLKNCTQKVSGLNVFS